MPPTPILATRYLLHTSQYSRTHANAGDVLLSGETDFIMNTDWLSYLNLRFPSIDTTDDFTPAPYSFSRPEHEPLAFLFEFFQMLPKLKLTAGKQYHAMPDAVYDLNPMRAITELRLDKVEADRLFGLQYLTGQLKSIKCRRSIPSLHYFFVLCARDEV